MTQAQGSYGGWQIPLSNYGISPGAGHLATALFFDDAALVSDYLYRNAVAGHPELNQMNTAINMAGHDINNSGQVNAHTVKAAADITAGQNISSVGCINAGGGLHSNRDIYSIDDVTTDSWFGTRGNGGWISRTWNGGWYMRDPDWVRSVSDKGVYTHGQMRADVYQLGNMCRLIVWRM